VVVTWTSIQLRRLQELNASAEQQSLRFATRGERNCAFQDLERGLVSRARQRLEDLRDAKRRPLLCQLESNLATALTEEGFVQVATPNIISKASLAKMSISAGHPLFAQVFWLDDRRCLRPMLAPNLYTLWRDLVRLWEKPIRIFEIGTCYRKELQGSQHLNEFTMLNITELGLPLDQRHGRLEELTSLVMAVAEIDGYTLIPSESAVYGHMLNVVKGVELASGTMGPHPLDGNWGIAEPWIGICFGLERLLMVREGTQNVQCVGRSLSYLDGVRLNI